MRRQLILSMALTAMLLALASGASAYTGSYPKMQVRILWPSTDQLQILRALPDLDPMRVAPGEEMILVSHPEQIERLEALGFHVEVQIADMEEHYAAQRDGYRNFGLLYTYSEMIEHLDQLHADFPDITTEKLSLGTSIEGRDVWAMKVSDNPDVDEDEPEVLFDALHHAREPITVNVLIETIRTLCEGYGTDPELTFLVNSRETWFVPVINPDGYVYNEDTYPGGGGMWRKNRRDNEGSSCYGVDPNRNYPYEWGGVGSSGDPCSDTYRGTEPGSEPCVQALMGLMSSREFVTHDSYHSVAGMILIPWAYTNDHTPDDALFREMAYTMREWCGYQVGQAGEILYNCSGVTTDYAYGDFGILSFCTEVDGSGFWPNDSEVPGLVAENIPKNLYLMKAAGCFLSLVDAQLSGGDGDGHPDPGETLDLVTTLHNDGVIADAENVSITLRTRDAYVLCHEVVASIGTIATGDTGDNAATPFSFTVDAACPAGHILEVMIDIVADGFEMTATWQWEVGDPVVVYGDDMESGPGGWTHDVVTGGFVDEWHQSTQRNNTPGGAVSWKFGSTGAGDYADLADGALSMPPVTIDADAQLRFWHWMDAEESGYYAERAYDGGLIELSVDGGPWAQVTPVDGYTHTIREGGTPGPFPEGTEVFSGTFGWRQDRVALEGMAGSIQVRFRFGSDGASSGEGWYVDDLQVVDISLDNLPPSSPTLVSPEDGTIVGTSAPMLVIENATDPDPGDVLTYGFRVFGDAYLTDLVTSADGIAEGTNTTSWVVSPGLSDGTYYWDAYAFDGEERGLCMEPAEFTVAGGQSVDPADVALRFLGVSPNPATDHTSLHFELANGGWVQGEIFDLQGRRVRSFAARFAPGSHALVWDGRNEQGTLLPAGVYLYALRGGAGEHQGRILRVR